GDGAAALHEIQRKSEHIDAIPKLAFQPEMNPAKDQRESNQRRNDAAPHDQKMHRPARESTLEDEPLANEIGNESLRGTRCVWQKLLALQIKLPSAPPINTRCRTL